MSAEMTDTPSVVDRADALLTRWEQRLSPGRSEAAPKRPARAGQGPRRGGVMYFAARGYVWAAARVGGVVTPIQQSWQQSVAEARRAEEQQAARRAGPGAAQQEGRKERQGEGALKKTAGATTEAAGTAADAAGG